MLISRGLSPPPGPGWSWQQCWLGHPEVTLGASMPHARHGHCQTTPGRYRQELTSRACTAPPAPTSVTAGTWGERPPPTLPRPSAACREFRFPTPLKTGRQPGTLLKKQQHTCPQHPHRHSTCTTGAPGPTHLLPTWGPVFTRAQDFTGHFLFLVKYFPEAKRPQRREEHQPPSSLRSSVITMAPTVFSPALRGSTSGSSHAPVTSAPPVPTCAFHMTRACSPALSPGNALVPPRLSPRGAGERGLQPLCPHLLSARAVLA